MRLPAEWERQSGVQLTWPHNETEWYELDKVLECYVDIARNILRFEPLMIVCRDIEEAKADIARVCSEKNWTLDVGRICFYEAPLNDTWARDHGGISVYGDNGEKYLYDFVFNGWGLKFASDLDNQLTREIFSQGAFNDDVLGVDMRPFVLEGGSIDSDGQGTLLTTTECLTSKNRNEYLSQEEIEDELKGAFGLDRVLWLDHGDIIGDDTDGHVDTLARFCSPDTIAYVQCTDPEDAHYDNLAAMERQLRSFRTAGGQQYNLVPLPLPDPIYLEDYRLPASYANFLIVNGGVLLPGSGSPKDEKARKALQDVFPDREVVVIDCRALLSGHGSLHCVTMQYPEGYLRTDNVL
ncbi:agmatine/peptidylarginine deiminase [Phocaeicola sartorii]|uniref:agmatine deiminase family protein n=1 Tax=Phocaeicola sartorii TaxID=671267 RepID=UPI002557DEEF|nr:agmatine deiminase family protein [Phocaeicola sartorii]